MGLADFTIFELSAGGGVLAISPLPGRSGAYEADFNRLLAWGPDMVVTMCEQRELARKGAEGLGADCAACGIDWATVPVVDFGIPEAGGCWPDVSARARAVLAKGGKVLCHCFAGCGRSGMAALRLMVELGEAPETALGRLRAVRPCAVERDSQFDWAAAAAATPGS